MRLVFRLFTISLLAAGFFVLFAMAGTAGAQQSQSRAVVLDTTGFWRIYHTLQPPVIQLEDELKPVLINGWLDRPTPEPPEGWQATDFDDRYWLRGPARINGRTPYVARLAMRARFTVIDVKRAAADLKFSAAYHGGIIVYLNGTEIARHHMPDGQLDDSSLAEPYPREAFVDDKNHLLAEWQYRSRAMSSENARRMALRKRQLDSLQIPASALRPGVNVLAVELYRAPYDKAVEELKYPAAGRRGSPYNLTFNTCEILHLQLSAASASGISQEATRPDGLQLWNSDALTSDFDLDFAGPSERLYPLRVAGPRGGIISGKIVAGSNKPLQGLKATLGKLVGPDGNSIPAKAVRIRYGLLWGGQEGVWGPHLTYWDVNYSRYPRNPSLFGALAEAPPAVVEVRTKSPVSGSDLSTPGQPEPVFGAVTPVWVTVDVPRDAKAGTYRAELLVECQDEKPRKVPVEVVVADWTLPERGERRAWVEMIQVPDTTAIEYDLPLWSDEHWQMIGRSFKLMSEAGSRVVHLPLVCNTNHGTAESMVRWVRQDDGSFKHDFTVLEKYLDTAIANMGKPQIVVLYAWDIYQLHPDKVRSSSSHDQERRALANIRKATGGASSGPVVTGVEASGEVVSLALPHFDEPESVELWAPVFAELKKILQQRGLLEAASLGCMSDAWPNADEVRALKELSDGLPWVSYSHMGVPKWQMHDLATVRYQATVTQNRYANGGPTVIGSHQGWAGPSWPDRLGVPLEERLERPGIFAENGRGGRGFDVWPASRLRQAMEFNITGDQRGIGRVGADFWSVIRDRAGNRRGRAAARFPQSSWRNQDLESSLLAPGPDGPVSTPGFEAFREGAQESEARIVIEEALLDEAKRARLGEELARRCTEALELRTHYLIKSLGQMRLTGPDHWYVTVGYTYWHRSAGPIGHQWFLSSQWQERSEMLYNLAAEVSAKLK